MEKQFLNHFAILPRPVGTDELVICSGSAINPKWLLTSATCVLRSSSYLVRWNSVNFYTGGNVYSTNVAFVNPHFNAETLENNIGVIAHGAEILGVALPFAPPEWARQRRQVVVAGWGLNEANEQSPVLQSTRGATSESSYALFVDQQACVGDTGSPVLTAEGNKYHVLGVASSPDNCLFSIITPLTRSWIHEITGT